MAIFHCNFFSRYLAYDTQVNVILPENREAFPEAGKKQIYPVFYLLHGRGDDCNAWIRGSRIEQFAMDHNIAVVMPNAEDSFYADSVNGKRYFSYMTKELPIKMQQWFPITGKAANTYIGGLSMGGYGALMLGLSEPEKYAGIVAMSAAPYPDRLYGFFGNPDDDAIMGDNLDRVFGGKPFDEKYMPDALLKKALSEGKRIPPILQYEGKQDPTYGMNQDFFAVAKGAGCDICYEEWDGEHNWKFWNEAIEKAMNRLFAKRTGWEYE